MIYVLSDIHGNERRFDSVLRQIELKPEDTLCVLGDVIDRYPGGISILRRLMGMPNVRMILGNHEYMMLRALGRPYDGYADNGTALDHWYRNGGKVTYDHLKRLPGEVQEQIVAYLRSLPLTMDISVGGAAYKLVHGAAPEDFDHDPRYQNPIHFAVWKRLELSDPAPEGFTLVFGHTPTRYYQDSVPMEIWRDRNRIGIDCGCGYPEASGFRGRLCCLRLEDGKVFYSEE